MSVEPVSRSAGHTAGDIAFAPRPLHAVPDEARTLPADPLYGHLLASAAQHAPATGPPHEGRLRRADGRVEPLPLDRWLAPRDDADAELLERVEAPVLDLGCGPGRHLAALRAAGKRGLGIDLSPVAVEIARGRGADAINGLAVFEHVPDAGSWGTSCCWTATSASAARPPRCCAAPGELLAPGGAIARRARSAGRPTQRVRTSGSRRRTSCREWFRVGARRRRRRSREIAARAGLRGRRGPCARAGRCVR